MSASSRRIDRLQATFDHEGIVPYGGLVVPATLMARLGLEALTDSWVKTGLARPGRKVLTLVAAMLAGAIHIDHVDMLRAGATQEVLPFKVMAPSTVGTFLPTFTFGHVRQLEAVLSRALSRAWQAGAGPGTGELVIDLDSTICEVHGKQKQGAAYGYTQALGYHPLLATRAATGEVLFARMRKGLLGHHEGLSDSSTNWRPTSNEPGLPGPITVRADSGFWSWDLIKRLNHHNITWSITVAQQAAIRAATAKISDDAWIDIDYTIGGQAQVAETVYTTGGYHSKRPRRSVRLVVRRSRLAEGPQRELWADWRHHAFITNTTLDTITADRFHRQHAVVELAIRDLKQGAGLNHIPSGPYGANAAWLACAVLAHNLGIWAGLI